MNKFENSYVKFKSENLTGYRLPYESFRAGWFAAISDITDHLDNDPDLSIIDRDTINVFLLKYVKSLPHDPQ